MVKKNLLCVFMLHSVCHLALNNTGMQRFKTCTKESTAVLLRQFYNSVTVVRVGIFSVSVL